MKPSGGWIPRRFAGFAGSAAVRTWQPARRKKNCVPSGFSLETASVLKRFRKCACFLATALKRVRLYTLQVIDSTFAADFRKIAGNLPASGSIAKYLRVERKKVLAHGNFRRMMNLQAGNAKAKNAKQPGERETLNAES